MNTLSSPGHLARHAMLALLFIACLAPTPALAETRYIKPTLDVTVRQNQSNAGKVIATLPIGSQVELVQGEKEWSLIRLPDETEGWVRSRYLSNIPILPTDILRNGQDGQPADPQVKMREISEENNRLKKELGACTAEKNTLADKYQTLSADSSNVQQTKSSLGEAQRQVEELQAKLATLQIENTVLKKNESIKWFLSGGSVVLLGWILGKLGNGNRKKKPSLLA